MGGATAWPKSLLLLEAETFQISIVYLEKRQERVIKDRGGVMQCEEAVFDGDFHR